METTRLLSVVLASYRLMSRGGVNAAPCFVFGILLFMAIYLLLGTEKRDVHWPHESGRLEWMVFAEVDFNLSCAPQGAQLAELLEVTNGSIAKGGGDCYLKNVVSRFELRENNRGVGIPEISD